MKVQDIYIKHSVEDKLPDESVYYFVFGDNSDELASYEGSYKKWYNGDGYQIHPTHWLEPVSNVYVMSEEEFEKHNEGYINEIYRLKQLLS